MNLPTKQKWETQMEEQTCDHQEMRGRDKLRDWS